LNTKFNEIMKKLSTIYLPLFLLFITISQVSAQNGGIHGIVYDSLSER